MILFIWITTSATKKNNNIANIINVIKINIGLSWVGVIVGEFIVSRYGREAFEINENSIKVTLPYNWKYKFEADLIDNPIDKLVDKLTNNEIIILKKIKDNPRMSQPEIASLLGMGKTTIQNAIVKFKKLNLIERIGSNKTGYWKVNI
mgnify:CR=1 FL=1